MLKDREFWVEIDGFPNYFISSYGRVRNWKTGVPLAVRTSARGTYVHFRRNGKNYVKMVHELVAEMFFTWKPGCQIKHVDGNVNHNVVSNLIVTGPQPKKPVVTGRIPKPGDIRIVETGETFSTQASLAEHIGGSKSAVCDVLHGKRPSHRGYTFERVT